MCRAHCRACGEHFASVEAFDAHRSGDHADGARFCIAPTSVANARSSRFDFKIGTCTISDPSAPSIGVQIWFEPERRQRAAPAFPPGGGLKRPAEAATTSAPAANRGFQPQLPRLNPEPDQPALRVVRTRVISRRVRQGVGA